MLEKSIYFFTYINLCKGQGRVLVFPRAGNGEGSPIFRVRGVGEKDNFMRSIFEIFLILGNVIFIIKTNFCKNIFHCFHNCVNLFANKEVIDFFNKKKMIEIVIQKKKKRER
jgi:hypothetical protein